MSIKILPQEFHFEDTSDSVRVKTVVGKDLIDEALLLRHVRHFRLGAGTIIKVQVMSKDYDVLLHAGDFVIERAVEVSRQVIDERGERTAKVTDYKIIRDGEWTDYSAAPAPVDVMLERVPEVYVPGAAEIKWSAGKKAWDVMVGAEIWTTIQRLDNEAKDDFKTRALAVAAGAVPRAA